jgi:hypothetical protein
MRVATTIQADDGKVEAIIGTHDLGVALGRTAYGQPRCADCQCVKKFASRNHDLFSS